MLSRLLYAGRAATGLFGLVALFLPVSAAAQNPAVAVDALRCTTERPEPGLQTLVVTTGTLRNLTQRPLANIQIETTLLAPEGSRPTGHSYGPTLIPGPLEPGSTVRFRAITNYGLELHQTVRCRVRIRLYGQKDWLALAGITETDFQAPESQGGTGAGKR